MAKERINLEDGINPFRGITFYNVGDGKFMVANKIFSALDAAQRYRDELEARTTC